MLQEFKVRNFKNFKEELLFSFKTENNYEFNRNMVINGIIKDCVIVGNNATGKTNLGYAIFDITHHLTDKRKKLEKYRLYYNLYNKSNIVYFKYTFKFGNSILKYIYEKKHVEKIEKEWLLIDDKEIIVNDLSGIKVELKGAENLNLQNWNGSISLVKYVYANTLLDANDKYCKVFMQFMRFVSGMLWISSTEGNRYIGFCNDEGYVLESISNNDGAVEKLETFLKEMGINYKLVAKDKGDGKNIYCIMGENEVRLSPLLSSGTKSLVFFFLWYLQIEKIPFIYIDEFDAFYHTDLSIEVLRKIIESANTQAVITSHNTDILSNKFLRPDCYFKLEDNKIKSFSDLTDKSLREANNLQKMYKAGAFND